MINKDDAPEGYVAKANAAMNCKGCAFNGKHCTRPEGFDCLPSLRKDKTNVIFQPK